VAAYAAFSRDLFSGWWLFVFAAAFFWVGGQLERAINARARLNRAILFYERGLARLNGRWAGTGGENGDRFLHDEHLYAQDLDLFGEASLFELLSSARTRIGEDTLAAWLKAPAEPSVVRARQQAVVELAPRTDLREDLAVLGENLRTGVNAEALAAWGELPARLASPTVPAWIWVLSGAGVLAVAGAVVWLMAFLELLLISPRQLTAIRVYVVLTYAVCQAVLWRFRASRAAILHDIHGGSWLYEVTAPRTFVRRRVDVRRVQQNFALLSGGVKQGARQSASSTTNDRSARSIGAPPHQPSTI